MLFLRTLKEGGINISGDITTNGYLLDRQSFMTMLDCGLTSFQVTIDGDKKSHDSTRRTIDGSDTYDVIMKNLGDIHDITGDFSVIVRCNVNKNTRLMHFIDDLITTFEDDKRFSLLLFPVADWNKSLNCDELVSKNDLFLKYTRFIKQKGVNDAYLNLYLNSLLNCQFSYPFSCLILPSGKLCFCTIDFSDYREITFQQYLSDLEAQKAQKLSARCRNTSCVLYPRCFGFSCRKRTDNAFCDSLLNDLKVFLKEYFYE